MADRKVYINAENKATFVCPECQKSVTKDVSRYTNIDKAVRVKCKCDCGHSYSVLLERRKYYRKETHLSGIFKNRVLGKGQMNIKDISRFGLKFEVVSGLAPSVGELIFVEFNLDDAHKTFISKEVKVKKVYDSIIGAEFCSIDSTNLADKRLGFYLMP